MSVVLRADRCVHQCQAYLAVVDVINLLQLVPLGIVTVEELSRAISRLLSALSLTPWKEHFHPKFHWMVHLPGQFRRWGTLVSCWTHERKHKVIKKYATVVHNTKIYEKSVLCEVIIQSLHDLTSPDCMDFTVGLVRPFRPVTLPILSLLQTFFTTQLVGHNCFTAHQVRTSQHNVCNKGDVVLIRSDDANFEAGEIMFNAQIHGRTWAMINIWRKLSYHPAQGLAEWSTINAVPQLIDIELVMVSVVWSTDSQTPGRVRTLADSFLLDKLLSGCV